MAETKNDFDKILREHIIIQNNPITENVFVLSFKRTFEFQPGQVIKISTHHSIPPRLYSIASGNKENEIRILYDVVPEGHLTPELSKLKAGDKIYASHPFGKFICNEDKAYWIATGTGIAPFVSMLYSSLQNGKTLIHGGRSLRSFYYSDNFVALGQNYIRCCSQEKNNEVYNGRLTQYLQERDDLPTDQKYYLCGSAEMVVEVRDLLISKGIPFNHIIAEIYF